MDTCYCCESKSTGREHVPPRCFFSRDKEPKNLITVPSCPSHNSGKSDCDEYLKFVLTASSNNIPSDVTNSTVRGMIRHIKKDSKIINKYGVTKGDAQYFFGKDFEVDVELICDCLDKIAKGIYYFHNKGSKKIIGFFQVSPIFLGINPDCSDEMRQRIEKITVYTYQDMREYPMHGENQDIFSYQVIENEEIIVLNMLFYKEKVVSTMFSK